MKSVGIITMHRVLNYGSVLQAWATQQIIRKMGYNAVVIDYKYPNGIHKRKKKKKYSQEVFRFFLHLYRGFPLKKKYHLFQLFWDTNLVLTDYFPTKEAIMKNPPLFDIYVAGSDQIWNPNFIQGDDTFFLSFAPKGCKLISYASSVALAELPQREREIYKNLLSRFSNISVRERNGVSIIENIMGKVPKVCLDPTMLLQKEDYRHIASCSNLNVEEPFILVYILQYAYDPYPYATKFIEEAQRQTKMKIVCIDFSAKQHLRCKDVVQLHDAIGPSEFVWLFSHAKLVITTSFHGTAFAVNFNIPVFSIVDNASNQDDRMYSLLTECGLENCIIKKGSSFPDFSLHLSSNMNTSELSALRRDSLEYLRTSLEE